MGRGLLRVLGVDYADEEYLEDLEDGRLPDPKPRVFEDEPHSISIVLGIVKIGEPARGEASGDTRIIRLPTPIVTLTHYGIGERIQEARTLASRSFVELTRILLQDGGQYGAADERAGNDVRVARAEALSVALRALPKSGELILRLFGTGNYRIQPERKWVDDHFPGKLEFLLGGKRNRIGDVADIEIGHDCQHALLFLLFNLLLGDLDPREFDAYRGKGGGHAQGDLRSAVVLT